MNKGIIKKIAEAPAAALQKAAKETQSVSKTLKRQPPVKKLGAYWRILGPGLTTGAADDDPSGIATYSQTGAQYGNQLLWLSAFTFPLMAVVQEACARIGLVTGRGLAANIRRYFPAPVLFACAVLLFVANTFNLGADLGAMAKATQLLLPGLPFAFLVIIFAAASVILQIFVPYKIYSKYLKWLALVLLAYIFSALSADLNWSAVIRQGIFPSLTFSREQIFLVCGILGTTISPYLFFWQTSQEVEEEIAEGRTTIAARQAATNQEIKKMRIDVWSGMFFSNLVMFFIIATCAGVLFKNGITDIQTAEQAAAALRPFAGDLSYLFFAVGIIGVGLLAVPVLAGSAAYAISESFGWKEGLWRKLAGARAFYGIIIIATVVGLLTNFLGLDPIKALIYAAVLNGLVAPLVLVLIMLISGDKKIMGSRANRGPAKFFGWAVTGFMILVGVATIVFLI
ncbi:MAG: divalent metal cation transporter [Patescibacteria group bacterium]